MNDKLGAQILKKIIGLCLETYSYLKDNNDEGKKVKGRKSCIIKREFSFKDYKKCLMASRFLNIISYLEKNEIDVDCLKEYKKRNHENRMILKKQQRFRSEMLNVLTKEINKIALSSNGDKIIQSAD